MGSDPIMYGVLIVLILCSAFFSGVETAFSSVNKLRLKNYEENGVKNAGKALDIAENFDKALSTILVGNNVVNISTASIATMVATAQFGASGVAIATAVTTVFVLIFGEILPKSYAKENSEQVALASAGILKFLITILAPVVFFFIKLKDLMVKLMEVDNSAPSVTEQELIYIIEAIEEEGVINDQESELVQSALKFDDITVQRIFTPRLKISAIDINDPLDEIVKQIVEEGFSRMPVYDKNIDKIIGILLTRDLLNAVVSGEEVDILKYLTKPVKAHKNLRISHLLTEFRKQQKHMAIVRDDYSGTMGIVTMEDVLEALVGEIWDEDEKAQTLLKKEEDNTYSVSGELDVYDLLEELDIKIRDFECSYNTVGGWVYERLGHIPEVGERFTYKNMIVKVVEMDDTQVSLVNITLSEDDE